MHCTISFNFRLVFIFHVVRYYTHKDTNSKVSRGIERYIKSTCLLAAGWVKDMEYQETYTQIYIQ